MSKRFFEGLPEASENEMHAVLRNNKNKRIEVYDYLDGILLFYQGKKNFFLLARPCETAIFEAEIDNPFYEIRKVQKPTEIYKGREKCKYFEDQLSLLVSLI